MATADQIRQIIATIAPYAQMYAKRYGYPFCSPCIAQALQESLGKYDGLSLLAYKYHNYHGIKGYPAWKGGLVNMKTGEEYTPGKIKEISSDFCIFKDVQNGIEEYFLFLERNKRYRNLKACISPEQYIQTIRADGYCTSNTYVENCIGKINSYNLKQYDNGAVLPIPQYTPTHPIITDRTKFYAPNETYTLQSNLYIRGEADGENLLMDMLTENAKKNAYVDNKGYAILRKGTRVTCKEVKEVNHQVWLKIPSGWICAINKYDKVYVK